MKILTTLSALFMIGGSIGWILELFYRRMAHGKWINPGFLTGPCLPLYGSGVLLLYGFCSLSFSFISSPALRNTAKIILLTIALSGIEYITGLIFTKIFHVKLWDYSTRPGNIQGIICPLFSVIWGAVGAVYMFLLHPHFVGFINWLGDNPLYNFFSGMYMGVFIVDVCYSFRIVTKIKKFAEEEKLLIRYENLKLNIANRAENLKAKKNFAFPFRSTSNLREELEHYISALREKGAKKFYTNNKKK